MIYQVYCVRDVQTECEVCKACNHLFRGKYELNLILWKKGNYNMRSKLKI